MNKLTLAAYACAAITITSCQTVQQTATTTDIKAKVMQVPTVADLVVQPQRVEASQDWNWKFLGGDCIAQRKKHLVYDIVKNAKADVLVEPHVNLTKKTFGKRSLTISGYPATYKNFRKASKEDMEAIHAANGTLKSVVIVGDSAHYAAVSEGKSAVAPVKGKKRTYTEDAILYANAKKKQKAHFYIKGSADFNSYKKIKDAHEMNSKVGYEFALGIQKPIKSSSFYYGPELGVCSRGMNIDQDDPSMWGEGLAHGVFISPINFGYQYKINELICLDTHIGLPVNYYYLDNIEGEIGSYYHYLYDDNNGWDLTLKAGIGIWIKNFNIEANYKRGLLETIESGHSQSFSIGIGVRF